jgi:hypothetical protein
MKEYSPVEKCKKNRWKKGTILRCKWEDATDDEGNDVYEEWKITGFGEYWVLGKQVNLKENEISGETFIPFYYRTNWRKA